MFIDFCSCCFFLHRLDTYTIATDLFLSTDKVALTERPLRNAFLVCHGKSSVPPGKIIEKNIYSWLEVAILGHKERYVRQLILA